MNPPLKRKDPLLRQVIDYLRLQHDLCEAYLVNKSTTTTQTQTFSPSIALAKEGTPPGNNSFHRTFTYTLLIITKSPHPSYNLNQQKVFANPNEVGVTQTHPPIVKSPSEGNPAQIMDALYNLTQKQAKVHLLPFTLKAVRDKLEMGDNFLSKTLSHAPCLYKENHGKQAYTLTAPVYDKAYMQEIRREWGIRHTRAAYLYENVRTLHPTHDPVACFEILHNLLTQTCLGLIYVFLEYKPGYTALPYLMHLCSLFTDLPEKVFPATGYRNQHLLYHLYHAKTMMVYKTRHSLTLKDADRAWRKCGVFLGEARELVEERMERSIKY